MKQLNDFMWSSLGRKGLKKEAEGAYLCFLATEWGQGRFKAVSFSQGILKLSVCSSPAAQEVQMETEKLSDYLNSKIGRKAVRGVRIVNYK